MEIPNYSTLENIDHANDYVENRTYHEKSVGLAAKNGFLAGMRKMMEIIDANLDNEHKIQLREAFEAGRAGHHTAYHNVFGLAVESEWEYKDYDEYEKRKKEA